MNSIQLAKALGYGIVIWLIMFALTSALIGFGVTTNTFWFTGLSIILAAVLAYTFAALLQPKNLTSAAFYGLLWVILGMVLDLVISARFEATIFSHWSYWISYAVILLSPMLEEKLNEPVKMSL